MWGPLGNGVHPTGDIWDTGRADLKHLTYGFLYALFKTREEHRCYLGGKGYRWICGTHIYYRTKNVNESVLTSKYL